MASGQPSSLPPASSVGLLRVGASVWVENSVYSHEIPPAGEMARLDPLAWTCIGVGAAVLAHSWLLHRTRLTWTRVLVEVSGLGSILGGIFFLLGTLFQAILGDHLNRPYLIPC